MLCWRGDDLHNELERGPQNGDGTARGKVSRVKLWASSSCMCELVLKQQNTTQHKTTQHNTTQSAITMGADAVIGVRYDSSPMENSGSTDIFAYGTAVTIAPATTGRGKGIAIPLM